MKTPSESVSPDRGSAANGGKHPSAWLHFPIDVYPGARWMFWIQVVLSEYLLWSFAGGCNEGGSYLPVFELMFATMACLSFWVNHINAIRVDSAMGMRLAAKVFTRGLRDFLALVVVFALLAVPVAGIAPIYHCYTPRSMVSELLLTASSFKQEVTERALDQKSLTGAGTGLKVIPTTRLKAGIVTEDGVIVIAASTPPAIAVFIPKFDAGRVVWNCRIYPAEFAYEECRDPGSKP
jgi:hypothetical protein